MVCLMGKIVMLICLHPFLCADHEWELQGRESCLEAGMFYKERNSRILEQALKQGPLSANQLQHLLPRLRFNSLRRAKGFVFGSMDEGVDQAVAEVSHDMLLLLKPEKDQKEVDEGVQVFLRKYAPTIGVAGFISALCGTLITSLSAHEYVSQNNSLEIFV